MVNLCKLWFHLKCHSWTMVFYVVKSWYSKNKTAFWQYCHKQSINRFIYMLQWSLILQVHHHLALLFRFTSPTKKKCINREITENWSQWRPHTEQTPWGEERGPLYSRSPESSAWDRSHSYHHTTDSTLKKSTNPQHGNKQTLQSGGVYKQQFLGTVFFDSIHSSAVQRSIRVSSHWDNGKNGLCPSISPYGLIHPSLYASSAQPREELLSILTYQNKQ